MSPIRPAATATMNRALHVLVAEDHPANQKLAIAALKKLGHTGVLVGDGDKALRCLAQLKFDLILLDVMMPVMDGMQVLAAVREGERGTGRRQPVIMATAHDAPDDRERMLLAGADGYVAKPLKVSVLASEIERVFATR